MLKGKENHQDPSLAQLQIKTLTKWLQGEIN